MLKKNYLYPYLDFFLSILVYPSGLLLKLIRHAGIQYFPVCKKVLIKIGIFPIRNHYYEPLFDYIKLRYPLTNNRILPGIDWNNNNQLLMLEKFSFNDELLDFPVNKRKQSNELEFSLNNSLFGFGDAEYWYNIIRLKKPKRIIEVGSGNSTLVAIKAINRNKQDDPSYNCEHICIEPYEMPWLEQCGATIIRSKVEDVDISIFKKLGENDILFIDSSHIIRPQGDVLFEYLEVLPTLNDGVIVHIHDIFSPKDYPEKWLKSNVYFWNEQYLLEAFLTSNSEWKIIGALNYLHHNHFENLKAKCPHLSSDNNPGSFYIQKVV